MEPGGKLSFEYEMACVDEDRRLYLEVDGGPPMLLCSSAARPDGGVAGPSAGAGKEELRLSAGVHVVRWVYQQRLAAGAALPAGGAPVPRLHEIVVVGVAAAAGDGGGGVQAGGAHECHPCAAGWYAGGGWTGSGFAEAESCLPCPAGQTSLPRSTVCTPCPADTFAPRVGSPRCWACGQHMHSAPGSIACSQDCLVDLQDVGGAGGGAAGGGGGVIDLKPLQHVLADIGPVAVQAEDTGRGGLGARAISLALCGWLPANSTCVANMPPRTGDETSPSQTGKLGDAGPGEGVGVAVCAQALADDHDDDVPSADLSRSRAPVRLGSLMSLDALPPSIQQAHAGGGGITAGVEGVTVRFEGGQLCQSDVAGVEATTRWQTQVHILCNTTAGVGRPHVIRLPQAPPCSLHLVWPSQHGCPLCRSSDYRDMGGDCVEGYRDIVYTRVRECFAGEPLPPRQAHVACRSQMASLLPAWAIALIAAGAVLILGVLAFLAHTMLAYRRMYRHYQHLSMPDAHSENSAVQSNEPPPRSPARGDLI